MAIKLAHGERDVKLAPGSDFSLHGAAHYRDLPPVRARLAEGADVSRLCTS